MITPVCQRWRSRRDSYRPAGEVFDPRSFEVEAIASDATARAFVETHHYSGSLPAARRRFGLYERDALVGVAVFSVPTNERALLPLPGGIAEGLELGRFVLLDGVRANGESWFLARCLDVLRVEGWAGVVSFADPEQRTRADGSVAFVGHLGTIYQASNACYLGRATPRSLRLFPDGTVFSARARQKIVGRERGWRYAVEQLVAHGADAPDAPAGELGAWLTRSVAQVTRPLRHAGNHKYVFALQRGVRRALPASKPFPKLAGWPS